MALKTQLNTKSGFIYGSNKNFGIIVQNNSTEFKDIKHQNLENKDKNIGADTLIKADKNDRKRNNKNVKYAPQRSKWGISRKGESTTDTIKKNRTK